MMLKSLVLNSLGIFVFWTLSSISPAAETGKSMAKKKLQIFLRLVRIVSDESETKLRVLTWNVFAPIRINATYLAATGNDVNLVQTDLRMYVIAKQILEIDADIVYIQEIQIDTYEILNGYLEDIYERAGFSSHGPSYRLAKPGETNVRNGVTLYYRKGRFVLQGSESFQTSQNGNFAQAVTLKRMDEDGSPTGLPIGEVIHKKIKEITMKLIEKKPTEVPLVIVGGDFKSLAGYPGVEHFKARGYTDVRIVTGNAINSIYYPELEISAFSQTLRGLPVDTFMVPTTLVNSNKLLIRSLDVADVMDREHSENVYITKVLGNVVADMRAGNINGNTSKIILESLVNIMSDGNDYDTSYNRAMRIGSNHAPVLATFWTPP